MDGRKKKKPCPATGSTIVDDLFGPKGTAAATPTTGAGYFSTVFPTPSAAEAMGKDASRRAHSLDTAAAVGGGGGKPAISSKGNGGSPESPYFGSSSVHYGGRDFVDCDAQPSTSSKQSTAAPALPPKPKVDAGDTSAVTRGDWWQGSLYY